ncbi:TadE family protein [Cupriavidus metallidurans]|uniref:TadE family protein n=1 Tax=Cupriavidus metallidurans TaxID=119219 RepID=UPI00056173F4|nr:TadE/TadG family type IV pilus assembly protein [Cupriavidus metallidurans]
MHLTGNAYRRRAKGIAALEFAIVAPLFLTLVLGITYYGTVFVLQQALTLAAEEGARAALRYPLTSTGGTTASTLDLRVAAAAQTARGMLPTSMSSLISSANVAQPVTCASPSGTQCVQVTLSLPTRSILPSVPMVPVPAVLTGSAMVQLSPDI